MTCGFCEYVKKVLYGELVVADEAANVLLPGDDVPDAQNPHNTVSQRLGQLEQRSSKSATFFCKALTAIQNGLAFLKICSSTKDHCTSALQGFPQVLPTDG